jgi:hypothetical protein
MIIWEILSLQHEDAIDVQFVLLGDNIDHDVGEVVALPDASIYILEAEETAVVLYAVLWTAHKDYFEVSESL